MKFKLSKKMQLIFAGVIIAALIMAVTVNMTDACRLESVILNDQTVDNFDQKYGLNPNQSILDQPLDSLAEAFLAKRNIFKVEMSYSLLNGLKIRTNAFKPVCILLDKNSGKMYGLNQDFRVVNLENCDFNWETPVMTSLTVSKLYEYPSDDRVTVVAADLEKLKSDNPDMYYLIDEIDFGNRKFIKVSIDGLDYRLKLRAESFTTDLNKFIEFVSRFNPDTEKITGLDLRFDDMIISCIGKK